MNKRRSDAHNHDATLAATLSGEKRCTKELVSARFKEFRGNAGLTQPAMADRANHMPLPSYKDYEVGNRLPGAEALESFVAAGINVNWLLTGDGPMLLADLAPKPVQINVKALAAIIEGLAKAGLPPAKLGQTAVRYYQDAIAQGLITPAGIGDGDGKASA